MLDIVGDFGAPAAAAALSVFGEGFFGTPAVAADDEAAGTALPATRLSSVLQVALPGGFAAARSG